MRISDWSSDVCSSDLPEPAARERGVSLPDNRRIPAKSTSRATGIISHLRSPLLRMAISLRFVLGMGNMNRWVETLDVRQQRFRQSMSTGYQIHDRRVLGRTVWSHGRVLESGGLKIALQRTRVQVDRKSTRLNSSH